MTIGKRITILRKQNDMTQSELAKKVYVSPKTVSKWENDYGLPDLKTIPLLAESLQVDIDYLLTGKTKIPINASSDRHKETPSYPEFENDPKAYKLAIYQVTHNHLSIWLLFINVIIIILTLISGPIERKILETEDFSPFTILTAIYPPWGSSGNSEAWEIAISIIWLILIVYILITSFLFLRATLNGTNEYYLKLSVIQFTGITALFILSFIGSILTNLFSGENIFRLNVFYALLMFSSFFQLMLVFLVSKQGKVLHSFKSLTFLALVLMVALSATGLTIPQKTVPSVLDPNSISCSDVSYVMNKSQTQYIDQIETRFSGTTLFSVTANKKVKNFWATGLYMWLNDNTLINAQTDISYLKTSYKNGIYLNFFELNFNFITISEATEEIDRIDFFLQIDPETKEYHAKTESIQIYENTDPELIRYLGNVSGNLDWENGYYEEICYETYKDLTITGYSYLNTDNLELSLSIGQEDSYGNLRFENSCPIKKYDENLKIGPSFGNGKKGYFAICYSVKTLKNLTPTIVVQLQTTAGSVFLPFHIDKNFVVQYYLG